MNCRQGWWGENDRLLAEIALGKSTVFKNIKNSLALFCGSVYCLRMNDETIQGIIAKQKAETIAAHATLDQKANELEQLMRKVALASGDFLRFERKQFGWPSCESIRFTASLDALSLSANDLYKNVEGDKHISIATISVQFAANGAVTYSVIPETGSRRFGPIRDIQRVAADEIVRNRREHYDVAPIIDWLAKVGGRLMAMAEIGAESRK